MTAYRLRLTALLALMGLSLSSSLSTTGSAVAEVRDSITPLLAAGAEARQPRAVYGMLPLAFVPNAGQSDHRVRFSAQAGGASFWLTPTEVVLALNGGRQRHVLRLAFVGANPRVAVEGANPAPGTVSYIRGNDPNRWHTGLQTFGEVVYRELWPGVDVAFRGTDGKLKYEFRVAPGARPSDIRLAYRGAGSVALGREGELRIHTSLGVLRDSPPVSYQDIDGRRTAVESRYVVTGSDSYGFAVDGYDRRYPIVIDPSLAYSSYLGGSGADHGLAIAVDGSGNAYVTGQTASADFPTTAGAFDTLVETAGADGFVTKVSADGSALVYSTVFGGSSCDLGLGIAVDAGGQAYVTGETCSLDFPTTPDAFDTTRGGTHDGFVMKLDATGATLVYSTYLGGGGGEDGLGIAVDAAGNAYVTGVTGSADFPITPSAFDTILSGGGDAFITKLNAAGSAFVFSTYLGGSAGEQGRGITVDASGNTYVTGRTNSLDFPTTAAAFDTTYNGSQVHGDAFVTKLDAVGSALVYSTYLGGTNNSDLGSGIAVDTVGNAYVTGRTLSGDFPTTAGAFDTTSNGPSDDAFVTKVDGTGALAYSTYLGGSFHDEGKGIAVDAAGNAYLVGRTDSADFPTTPDAFDTVWDSNSVFVTRLDGVGSTVTYSTFLSGSAYSEGNGIALDVANNAYVVGLTTSADFPTTRGAFDRTYNDDGTQVDAFVAKVDFGDGSTHDVGVAGFRTKGHIDASRNGLAGFEVTIKVKNYGDLPENIRYAVTATPPGEATFSAACSSTVPAVPPGGVASVAGCTVDYSGADDPDPTLTLTVNHDHGDGGLDANPSNDSNAQSIVIKP